MNTFWFYLNLGFNHVTDLNGLDHFYFLIALSLPFQLRDWKKLFIWVSFFTLGHSVSLIGSYFGWVKVEASWVEFLIPITIGLTCLSLLFNKKHSLSAGWKFNVITLFFGVIHGFGFAKYFLQIVFDDDAILALLEFALGVEFAQLIIIILMITINFIALKVLKFNLQKWQWIIAAMVLSEAIRMTLINAPF